jgi:hypothetical protein
MDDRKAAHLTGVLFIAATVADLLGAVVRPPLTGPAALDGIAASPERVAASALLLAIAAFACAGVAIAMYPVLRRTDATLALGSVAFRTLEAAAYLVAVMCLLTLGSIARVAGPAGAAPATTDALGGLLLSLREHAAVAGVLAFCLGATLYYRLLFRARLVPRWLSGWGMAAIALLAVAALLALAEDRPVTGYALLGLPILVQEMVLAAWLIVKGFAPQAAGVRTAGAPAGLATAAAPAASR